MNKNPYATWRNYWKLDPNKSEAKLDQNPMPLGWLQPEAGADRSAAAIEAAASHPEAHTACGMAGPILSLVSLENRQHTCRCAKFSSGFIYSTRCRMT